MLKNDFLNDGFIRIMGILNRTPDSFSDGGRFYHMDDALRQVETMIKDGADLIDIGGESTRPFSEPVSAGEELERVIPIIQAVKKRFDIVISVDTYKSEVAKEALINGVEIINDISGFTFDPEILAVVEEYKPACIVMHILGTPKNMQMNPVYQNVVEDVFTFLKGRIEVLKAKGISQIIADPGFGFGKSLDDNYRILRELHRYQDLKVPLLAGISRKSLIGKIVNVPPEERDPGSIALNTIALLNGAQIIRVHDVAGHVQAVRVIEKYRQENSPG